MFSSSFLTIVIILLAPWLADSIFSKPELMGPLRLMAIAIVPVAIFTLHAQALQGLKRIREAMLVLSVWLPFFSLIGCIILASRWEVMGVVWAYLIAAFITLIIGVWRWRAATPQLKVICGYFETKTLLKSSMPLFWIVALNLVITWSSLLMLGIWEDSEKVGIFGVASRTAMLISFVLIAVNSIAAPKFAELYEQNDTQALGNMARNSAKMMMVMASPALLLFLLVPSWIMQIFGEQFIQGAMILSILAVGQFVNVATGSVGYLLVMSGNEQLLRNSIAFCAAINLILNITLIPYAGISGAAIATAITLALQNLIAVGLVWKKLKIMTLPVGH